MLAAFIYLIICSVCLCIMSLLRKYYEIKIADGFYAAMIFMTFYSLFVSLGGGAVIMFTGKAGVESVDSLVIVLAIVISLTITATTIICIIGTAYGNVSILVMFATLGTLVLSTLYGLIFDSERNTISAYNIIGMVIVAVIIAISFFAKTEKGADASQVGKNNKIIFFLLCVTVFFTNGIALVLYSIITKYRSGVGNITFITLYSSFMLIESLIISVILRIKGGRDKKPTIEKKNAIKGLGVIFSYAVLFCLGEVLSMKTTTLIPIAIQSPLSFSIELIILTVFDRIVFKAKLTKNIIIQMVLGVIASVCFVL